MVTYSVDNVELVGRFEMLESNWVEVLVDDKSDLYPEVHDHETLSTDLERHDLDSVRDQKTRPCKGVEDTMNPDEGHNGISSSFVSLGFELR